MNNNLKKKLKMIEPTKITYDLIMDDPTEVLGFRFLDEDGKITKLSIKEALRPPYPAKYYMNTILFIVLLTVFLLWNFGIIPGHKLGFFCRDPLFAHKYNGDTITPTILGVGVALLPTLLYFLVEYVREGQFKEMFRRQNLLEFYLYFRQFVIGIILVGGFTELAKTIVAEHRPHFFDICWPDTNLNCTNGTYISTYTCIRPDVSYLDIIDASRSFPSGHSSLSWFCALFTAFMVYSRLPVRRTGTLFKLLMLIICFTFGLVSSLTRITDRRHHWWDVLIGTIIGILGTAYSTRIMCRQIDMLRHQVRISEDTEMRETSERELQYSV